MASMDFYGSWEDSISLIERILGVNHFSMIPDVGYKDEEYLVINSFEKFSINQIEPTKTAFLWSENYSHFPVKLQKTQRSIYVIRQLESGPLIQIHFPKNYEKNGKLLIGRGNINYPPYFLYPGTLTRYSPPKELVKIFRLLKTDIQKEMVMKYWKPYRQALEEKTASTIEKVWIGKKAAELLKTGDYLISNKENNWYTNMDFFDQK